MTRKTKAAITFRFLVQVEGEEPRGLELKVPAGVLDARLAKELDSLGGGMFGLLEHEVEIFGPATLVKLS